MAGNTLISKEMWQEVIRQSYADSESLAGETQGVEDEDYTPQVFLEWTIFNNMSKTLRDWAVEALEEYRPNDFPDSKHAQEILKQQREGRFIRPAADILAQMRYQRDIFRPISPPERWKNHPTRRACIDDYLELRRRRWISSLSVSGQQLS